MACISRPQASLGGVIRSRLRVGYLWKHCGNPGTPISYDLNDLGRKPDLIAGFLL